MNSICTEEELAKTEKIINQWREINDEALLIENVRFYVTESQMLSFRFSSSSRFFFRSVPACFYVSVPFLITSQLPKAFLYPLTNVQEKFIEAMGVIATNMASRFDLKQLETHLKHFTLPVTGLKKRKRDRDTTFLHLPVTKDQTLSPE